MPSTAQARFDAVMNSPQRDEGAGVPYQVQYSLTPKARAAKLWIEDTGRWFAGDGRQAGARARRHPRHQRAARAGGEALLSVALRRPHRRDEPLASHRGAGDHACSKRSTQRGSCGLLLIAIDNLARLNEAYGFDVADEVIGAVAKRLRAKMRGGDQLGRFSGNKFARDPEQLHARGHGAGPPSGCWPACATTWSAPRAGRSRSPSRSAA